MTLEIGYHVMSPSAVENHGVFDDELSIVEFLRRVHRREELPLDVTVYGLDRFLAVSGEPKAAAEYVHTQLRDRVNFVLNQSPVVQFVVDDIQHWDDPVLPVEDENLQLRKIFGGSFDPESPDWCAGEFNVQS